MGNSDSRPTREKEIDNEFKKEERRIDGIKMANVSELKKALHELNTKTRELNEAKWNIERLNSQISNGNALNVQLAQQNTTLTEKYNSAVMMFSGIVLIVAMFIGWLLMKRHDPTPHVINDALYNSVISPTSPETTYSPQTYADQQNYSDDVLIVSPSALFDVLSSTKIACSTQISNSNLSPEDLSMIWEDLKRQKIYVSYTTLLSLVTSAFSPFISLGLVASCIGVLFAALAAIFSVLFFWSEWDGPIQMLIATIYTLGFTLSGIYMHKTARDVTLQIPGGSLVVVGCCSMYLVILAVFQTVNTCSTTVPPPTGSVKHEKYLVDPMFRFVAILAVGASASACLYVIPFAPLGVIVISAGALFVVFSAMLFLDTMVKFEENSNKKATAISFVCLSVLSYSGILWLLLNPHCGYCSVYIFFAQGTNPVYPLSTDVGLWIEWSLCMWGFSAILVLSFFHISNKSFDTNDSKGITTVLTVNAILYCISLGTIYLGILTQSLAISVVGHLGILLFNFLSITAPIPLLAMAYAGLILASDYWQAQAVSLVGPLETLSSVILGPLGIFMVTIIASVADMSEKSCVLPFQTLLINIALISWGTYVSRTLMFLVGLVGIAIFVIHVGFTFMKGSVSFIFFLVVLSLAVVTVGIFIQ